MTNEVKMAYGASGFTSVGTLTSKADGDESQVSTSTVASLLGADEEDYPLLDFLLDISSGTPTENAVVRLYLRPKADGVNEAPAISGNYKHHYLGTFVLDNAADEYYLFNVPNLDKNGTFYLENESGATLTYQLYVRSRTYVPV